LNVGACIGRTESSAQVGDEGVEVRWRGGGGGPRAARQLNLRTEPDSTAWECLVSWEGCELRVKTRTQHQLKINATQKKNMLPPKKNICCLTGENVLCGKCL